jgi:hypothetical protein
MGFRVINNIEIRKKIERTKIISEDGGFFFMRTRISILC